MEESGLMGGGQGDGTADSHPTSGTYTKPLLRPSKPFCRSSKNSVMRGIFFKDNCRYRKLVFGLSKPFGHSSRDSVIRGIFFTAIFKYLV